MNKTLFKDFEGVSSKAWKQKIQADLKGADYNDTLIWKTNEGIDVKPFYHSDEFKSLPTISNSNATEWKICQFINVENQVEANKNALNAVKKGAESLFFELKLDTVNVNELLEGIDTSKTEVHIKSRFLSKEFIGKMLETYSHIKFHTDIIANLAQSGNWFFDLRTDHKQFEAIVKSTNQISIDLSHYQNAGATCTQQLAYGMAQANEYLNHLIEILSEQEKKSLSVSFQISVGYNYFFEIAKLRALRKLWAALASEYGIPTDCQIIASPSKRNKTIYDYNVNMLRTTTECMSAVLGGANVVYNLAYDALYHKSNEFGDRIARNQLLVLKKESYLDKVNNPADGAYYVESLTEQLAEKALQLFKDIEKNGGLLAQLKSGTIQRKIKESASREQTDFDRGNLVLLGTNKHPNLNDIMKNELEKSPFLRVEKRKTIIEPIIEKRLSEKLEINRLKEE